VILEKMLQEIVGTQLSDGRRSRMETFHDILMIIAAGNERPTHIMYKSNLSWRVMQQYMKILQSQGLVMQIDEQGRRSYRLSDKGFKLLEQFNFVAEGLALRTQESS
jgi:predicted transcriptional regulator